MPKTFTIASPRYLIKNNAGYLFNVFNKRINAIKAAIQMAVDFPGNKFHVMKKSFNKEKIIFSFQLEIENDFEDTQTIYKNIIDIFQKKSNKTKYWRKLNGNN